MASESVSKCVTSGKVNPTMTGFVILIISGLVKETVCSNLIESTVVGSQGTNSSMLPVVCSFFPDRVDGLVEGNEVVVTVVNCSYQANGESVSHVFMRSYVDDSNIVAVTNDQFSPCELHEDRGNVASNCSFVVRGLFLGRTVIRIGSAVETCSRLFAAHDSTFTEYRVSVVRKDRVIDHIFLGLVSLMVIFANVGMGCKIELPVVKEVLMKPIAPVIGFCCQYVIMPLVSRCI